MAMFLGQKSLLNTSTANGTLAGLVQLFNLRHVTVINCNIGSVYCMFMGKVIAQSWRGSVTN